MIAQLQPGLAFPTQDLLKEKEKKENFLRFNQLLSSLCLLPHWCLDDLRAITEIVHETVTKPSKSKTLVAGTELVAFIHKPLGLWQSGIRAPTFLGLTIEIRNHCHELRKPIQGG